MGDTFACEKNIVAEIDRYHKKSCGDFKKLGFREDQRQANLLITTHPTSNSLASSNERSPVLSSLMFSTPYLLFLFSEYTSRHSLDSRERIWKLLANASC